MVKNDGTLIIAKFGNQIITLKQYQEGIHREKIYCPFCSVKVLYNVKGYFAAWPSEGGHKCKDIRVNYFDADWEGSRYVEVLDDKQNPGGLEIVIDINGISTPQTRNATPNPQVREDKGDGLKFPKYPSMKKAFRDVVRSVSQMKRLLERNSLDVLKNLKYIVKIENERLNFNEVVFTTNQIGKAPKGKKRFFIFQVESIKSRVTQDKDETTIYINSYKTNGYVIAGVISFPLPVKKLKDKLQNRYVMAYGRMWNAKNDANKVFVTIEHDFHIVPLDEAEIASLFADCKIEKYQYESKMENPQIDLINNKALDTQITQRQNAKEVPASLNTDSLPIRQFTNESKNTEKPENSFANDSAVTSNTLPVNKKHSIKSFFKNLFKR